MPPCATVLAVLLQAAMTASHSAPTVSVSTTNAITYFDHLAALGSTQLQRRLVLLEGELTFGMLPCSTAVRWDAMRGVTVGCLQFGMLGRLQPVLLTLDTAHPDLFTSAFGARTEEVRAMLRRRSMEDQVAWARSLSDGNGQLVESWATSSRARLPCRNSRLYGRR